MKVLRYGRKTRKKEKYSFDDQSYEISEYCKRNGIEVVGGNKEIRSGETLKRPALQKVLERRRLGKIDGIIVASVDRLSRNVNDIDYLLSLSKKEGFTWFFARDNLTTQDEDSYTKILYYTKYAQREVEQMSARLKAALNAKRENNEKTGGYLTYGLDLEDGKTVINNYERNVQELIYELREKFQFSLNQIVKYLTRHNIPTKLGKKWYATTVRRNYLRIKNKLSDHMK